MSRRRLAQPKTVRFVQAAFRKPSRASRDHLSRKMGGGAESLGGVHSSTYRSAPIGEEPAAKDHRCLERRLGRSAVERDVGIGVARTKSSLCEKCGRAPWECFIAGR